MVDVDAFCLSEWEIEELEELQAELTIQLETKREERAKWWAQKINNIIKEMQAEKFRMVFDYEEINPYAFEIEYTEL